MVSEAEVMAPIRVPILPDVDPGVAVQRQDARHAVQDALLDARASAPPGMVSSAGWKITRTRAGNRLQIELAQDQCDTQHHRGVDVVAAGMADAVVSTEANSRPVSSMIGRASISARRPMAIGPSPTSTERPVPSSGAVPIRAAVNRAASFSVVRNSLCDSSGCGAGPGGSASAQPAAAMPRRRH